LRKFDDWTGSSTWVILHWSVDSSAEDFCAADSYAEDFGAEDFGAADSYAEDFCAEDFCP